MNQSHASTPDHYRNATRVLLRYAIVMTIVALVSGVLFQESAKKLDFSAAGPGLHIEATIHLALVHGHMFLISVILPLVLASALFLARRAGGHPLGRRPLMWLTRGYLPSATLSVLLMLYKGYHYLLSVRGGETDLAAVNENLFGGLTGLRHGIYGIAHVGLAVTLVVFLVALWRSLSARTPGRSAP